MKTILGLSLCLLIFSCNSAEESATDNNPEKVVDATTWEGYWTLFQQASADKDVAALQELSTFNETFTEVEFQSGFETFFGEQMQALIAKTAPDALFIQENMSDEFEEVRSIQLIETGTDEETGETYESALIILFGKRDGKFGMMRWGMAG